MGYQAEISRINPTCFFFLIDQSSSMLDPINGIPENGRKADLVADALSKVIQTLIITATKDDGVRRYYQIGAIGYGNVVSSAFGDLFNSQELLWVDELSNKPLRIEERLKKESDGAGGIIEVPIKFPIWIDPIANGRTPMCEAINRTKDILENWVNNHPLSYPPTVINLTDGEANDGDPRVPAATLKDLHTNDGNIIFMTVHASSIYSQPIPLPSVSESLPDDASKLMFDMCSILPDALITTAKKIFSTPIESGARGFVYNSGIEGIVSILEIGTKPANMR